MKIAVVYSRSSNVINLFGTPNKERIGLKTIKRIADSLKAGKHQVAVIEAGKDIVEQLEHFMPRVVKGERPGLVFNVSYGIQGQARYTHIPSILEMVGIPYIGSGPLAHSLALDKVVAKMIFRQQGLSTPEFAVLDSPGFDMPDLKFPLIVKPKNEAVSFGLRVVKNEVELRDGADVIFQKFEQPVLVEQFIKGREINVGILGNNPPEALPPAELMFGKGGPRIYTYEDKVRRSGREISVRCPARISAAVSAEAVNLAQRAFRALGCYDCARVDLRMDSKNRLYILEVNSLPSMGEHGSYTAAAEAAGLDYTALVNRLVDVAAARYFGTPAPPQIGARDVAPENKIFSFLIERRDKVERRVEQWTHMQRRTGDPTGVREAVRRAREIFQDDLKLRPAEDLTDERCAWTYETAAGLEGGTLLVGHLDVPYERSVPHHMFRRDPEHFYGEGVGLTSGPLAMTEYAMRALRHIRQLRSVPLGVLFYSDEGRDCRYSAEIIREAMSRAKHVLVLRPGNPDANVINQRRGWRRYELSVQGPAGRVGSVQKRPDVLQWSMERLQRAFRLTSRGKRIAVAARDIHSDSYPRHLPHRFSCTLLLNYGDITQADETQDAIRRIFGKKDYRWDLNLISDRPPMKKRKRNERISKVYQRLAEELEIPLAMESSLYPSVAGLAPATPAVICGVGPVAHHVFTPEESLSRISLMQRTLLLARYLQSQARKPSAKK